MWLVSGESMPLAPWSTILSEASSLSRYTNDLSIRLIMVILFPSLYRPSTEWNMLQQLAVSRSFLYHTQSFREEHILSDNFQEALHSLVKHRLESVTKPLGPSNHTNSSASIIVCRSLVPSELLTILSQIEQVLFPLIFLSILVQTLASLHHCHQYNFSGQISLCSRIKCSFTGPRCLFIFPSVKRLPLTASKDDEHRFIVFRY